MDIKQINVLQNYLSYRLSQNATQKYEEMKSSDMGKSV